MVRGGRRWRLELRKRGDEEEGGIEGEENGRKEG